MLPASSVTYSMQMWVLNPHAWALQFCRVLKPHELCHTRHCFYSNRAGKAWKQSCFAYKWINKQIILIKVHFWFKKKTLMNSFYHFYKQSCIGFVLVFFFFFKHCWISLIVAHFTSWKSILTRLRKYLVTANALGDTIASSADVKSVKKKQSQSL